MLLTAKKSRRASRSPGLFTIHHLTEYNRRHCADRRRYNPCSHDCRGLHAAVLATEGNNIDRDQLKGRDIQNEEVAHGVAGRCTSMIQFSKLLHGFQACGGRGPSEAEKVGWCQARTKIFLQIRTIFSTILLSKDIFYLFFINRFLTSHFIISYITNQINTYKL